MTALILWNRDHPVVAFLSITLLTGFFAFHALRVELDISGEGLTLEDDPDRPAYENALDVFGSDNLTVVYVKDDSLFTPRLLTSVEDAFYRLQDIPGVTRVDALFNATNVKYEDGSLVIQPLLDWVPEDAEALEILETAPLE